MFILEQTDTFSDWLNNLKDMKAASRIIARLYHIETEGHFGDIKSVGDNVFEMRFAFGPGYRIYYTYKGSRLILLLAGGDKSSQSRDIRAAKKMARDI